MAHLSLRTALLCLSVAILGRNFITCDVSVTAEGEEAFSDPDKSGAIHHIVMRAQGFKQSMTTWLAQTLYLRELVDTLGLYSDSPQQLAALVATINDNEASVMATITRSNPDREDIKIPGRILSLHGPPEDPATKTFEAFREKVDPHIRVLLTIPRAFMPSEGTVAKFVGQYSDALLGEFHKWGNNKITSDDLSAMRDLLQDALNGFATEVENVLRAAELFLDVLKDVKIPEQEFQKLRQDFINKVESWKSDPTVKVIAIQLKKMLESMIKKFAKHIADTFGGNIGAQIPKPVNVAEPPLPLPPPLSLQLPPVPPQSLQGQQASGLITVKDLLQSSSEKLDNYLSGSQSGYNRTDFSTTVEEIQTIIKAFMKVRDSFLKQLEPLRTDKPEIVDKIDFWFNRTGIELGMYLEIQKMLLLFVIQSSNNIPFADTWFDLFYLATLSEGLCRSTSDQSTSVSKEDLIGFSETFSIARENLHQRLLGVIADLRQVISKTDYHIFQHVYNRFNGMADPLLSLVDNLA